MPRACIIGPKEDLGQWRAHPIEAAVRMSAATTVAMVLVALAISSASFASPSATTFNSSEASAGITSPLSPIVVSIVPQETIVPVLGSDGRYHVLYELQLLNTLGRPADLRSVEVLDAGNAKTLLTLSAADIIKGDYLHTLDRQLATTTSFAPFEGRVLILNLSFDSKNSIPHGLTHRFEVSGADPFNQQPTLFNYGGGSVSVSRRKTPALLPPLQGPGWLASDGCCGPTGHRRAGWFERTARGGGAVRDRLDQDRLQRSYLHRR